MFVTITIILTYDKKFVICYVGVVYSKFDMQFFNYQGKTPKKGDSEKVIFCPTLLKKSISCFNIFLNV